VRIEPGATITAAWQDGEVITTADTTGQFSLTPVIPDGKTPVTLIAADAAGNETRASHVMLVDSGRPAVKVGGVEGWVDDTDHPKVYAFVDSASPTKIVAKINGQDAKVTPMSIGYTIEAGQLPSLSQFEDFLREAGEILSSIHQTLLERATALRDANIRYCDNIDDFHAHWEADNPGWLLTPWQGSAAQEDALAKQHKITIRCLPLADVPLPQAPDAAKCLLTQADTTCLAIWGRSY
jgi:hypothetical protein